MAELKEYHDLLAAKDRVPLYSLMKKWVFEEYPEATEPKGDTGPQAPLLDGPVIELKNMTYTYAEGLPPVLKDMTLAMERGAWLWAPMVHASQRLSILGGKRMIGRNK